jgi:spore germination protein YaaH
MAPLAACAIAASARSAPRSVTGYVSVSAGDSSPYWTLADHIDCFTALAPTWLSYDAAGKLTDHSDRTFVRYAHAHGVKVTPLVAIGSGKPSEVAHALFADAGAADHSASELLRSVKASGADGINVDIEGVAHGDRGLYNAFVERLCKAFHADKLLVTLDLPGKDSDAPDEEWPGFADYAFLGRHADQLQLMCYDEHWASGDPGPVGSLPWLRRVIAYAASVAPRSKVVLGVPFYGYDWPPAGPVASVTGVQAEALIAQHNAAPKWDADGESYWFQYPDVGSGAHKVYYETGRSLQARLDAANKAGIAGIAVWRLGDESAGLWAPLKRYRSGR